MEYVQPMVELWSANPDGQQLRIALTWTMPDCQLMKAALEAMFGNPFLCVEAAKPNV